MSATGGKVALVNSTTGLACNGSAVQPCSAGQLALIKDLVGYDGANFFEGSPAPTLSSTTAALRLDNGCSETDNNAVDFAAGTPTPRNTASPLNPCGRRCGSRGRRDVPRRRATDFPVSGNLTVSFSEPVNVTASWFDAHVLTAAARSPRPSAAARPRSRWTRPHAGRRRVLHADRAGGPGQRPGRQRPARQHGRRLRRRVLRVRRCAAAVHADPDDPGQRPVGGDHRHRDDAGRRGRRLRGDGRRIRASTSRIPTGDGNPATSDGIFVFTGSAEPRQRGPGRPGHRLRPGAVQPDDDQRRRTATPTAVPASNIVPCGTGIGRADGRDDAVRRRRTRRSASRACSSASRSRSSSPSTSTTTASARSCCPAARRRAPAVHRHGDRRAGRRGERPDARQQPAPDHARRRRERAEPARPAPPERRSVLADATASAAATPSPNAVGVLGFDFSLYRIFPTGPADYTAREPAPGGARAGRRHAAGRGDEHAQLLPDARLRPTGDPLDNSAVRQRRTSMPRRRRRPAGRVHPPARPSCWPRSPGSTATSSA